MSKSRQFTVDTNFFISGFGQNPNEFEIFHQILRRAKVSFVITDYVKKEMRWYMRRVIEPKLIVKEVKPKKLSDFESEVARQVDMKLPQTPDMSVAYLASQDNIPIVTSDLRLVEISQKLGMTAMMNSAFLVMLLGETKEPEDRKYLEKLYELLFAEEITYSVQSQSRYDPVVRIQKIMDSTLNVVRNQASISENARVKIKSTPSNLDIPVYAEMQKFTHEVRKDISKYITILEEGNYKKLSTELTQASALLTDLATESRMAGIEEEDEKYKETMTTVAHLLLMSCAVAIGEQDLEKAESLVDILLLFLLENDEVELRLDLDVHLMRITIFFLTEQWNRLRLYFSPTFSQLCISRERPDILQLHRTMSIMMNVLGNKEAEKTATARDMSEIEYMIQLGAQFVAVNNIENAWLLFEQAIYMSINSEMSGLLYAVFEVMLPISFQVGFNLKPTFPTLIKEVKKRIKSFPSDDYLRRSEPNEKVSEDLLRSRSVSVSKLPEQFKGFMDIISAEIAEFKKIGRAVFVRVIDWQTMHIIGIVDPTLSLDEKLTVGSSLQINRGKFQTLIPSEGMKTKRGINLLLIAKPTDLRFIVRRAGQLTIAQSKIKEFDL